MAERPSVVMDYGPKWRDRRKLISQEVTAAACDSYYVKLQKAEAIQMLRDFVESPNLLMDHPRRFSNSVIMSILLGIRTPSIDAPHMTRLYGLLHHFQKVMEFGATPPVDFFRLLKWILEQYLGKLGYTRQQGWAHDGVVLWGCMPSCFEKTGAIRKQGFGHGRSAYRQEKLHLTQHQLDFLGSVAMEGGSETTAATLLSFIKAMTCFQEPQKRAHAEIDAVFDENASPFQLVRPL